MTDNRSFKKRIRLRMRIMDESYVEAREGLDSFREEPSWGNSLSDKDRGLLGQALFYRDGGWVRPGTVLFAGDSGSGRTTNLRSTLGLVDLAQARIVAIENNGKNDFAGLASKHDDDLVVVSTQLNPVANVSWQDLLRSSLNMRPDVVALDELSKVNDNVFWDAGRNGKLMLSTVESNSLVALTKIPSPHVYSLQGVMQHKRIHVRGAGNIFVNAAVPLSNAVLEMIAHDRLDEVEAELLTRDVETVGMKIDRLIREEVLTVSPQDDGSRTFFV